MKQNSKGTQKNWKIFFYSVLSSILLPSPKEIVATCIVFTLPEMVDAFTSIYNYIFFVIFNKDFIYLLLERGREGERGKRQRLLPLMHPLLGTWPATQACALTGNWTSIPLVLRPALNPLSHTSQGRIFVFNCCFTQMVRNYTHYSALCFSHLIYLGHQLIKYIECFFLKAGRYSIV